MDRTPTSRPQDNTLTKTTDSSYGSLVTESSSSCLSLLSESDLLDEPSTSGCSSEMASHRTQSREKKRQVKEFLKELRSMVPPQPSGSKLDTLSTLNYVVSSMRKITEDQKQEKSQVFKAPSSEPVALPSLQCPEFVDFRNVNDGVVLNTQSELTAAVSLKNHVVLHTSSALMELLGYPLVRTVEPSKPPQTKESMKQHKQFFYARIRRFRSLASGFSVSHSGMYMLFKVMVTSKPAETAADVTAEDQKMSKRCMMLYFAPMVSPYRDGQLPPERDQRMFSLRHSLYCTYTYTHANTVALLGFLPQDIVGTSIFDYYHPDDLPQLLDIYRKAMHPMGQPFKSGVLRLRTRNGSYIKVTTEWSSFMNPWDYKLEFIIAQHTVVQPPDDPDVFRDGFDDQKTAESRALETSCKLINKITELLQKPMTSESRPLTPSDSEGAAMPVPPTGSSSSARDADKNKDNEKDESSQEQTSLSEISSSIIDGKSISSLYNQVNYSLNIKRFLLSHPKTFPVSDEDSSADNLNVHKDDSEEEMNEEVEMQVEIPVCRPVSCGSSTQVHVSEQGIHEEVPSSPPSFSGEDAGLGRDAMDSQVSLTESSLRKHTKAQELLYLQKASKEELHLLHLKSRRQVGQRSRQKRSRVAGLEETTNVFKFARSSKGQRQGSGGGGGGGAGGGGGGGGGTGSGGGGAPGLFMTNVPITAVDVKPTPSHQSSAGMGNQGSGMMGMVTGPYQPGMGMMSQLAMVPISPSTGMPHLQPVLSPPGAGIQWPYYPQSGYTLMPQVMGGFYQPVLQPMAMTAVTQSSPFGDQQHHVSSATSGSEMPQETPTAKGQKSGMDSDNPTSSTDDTTSSMQFLLDAVSANNSSPNEESEGKTNQERQRLQLRKMARRRSMVPPWLQTVAWMPEVRLLYKLPTPKVKSNLKKDRDWLKKMGQPGLVKTQLRALLEEVDSPDHVPPVDEEADYMFYPAVVQCLDGELAKSEEDGEKTPQGNCSPSATCEKDTEAHKEETAKSNDQENATDSQDKDCGGMVTSGDHSNWPMEVVVTENPPEPMFVDEAVDSDHISDSQEKVLSPTSDESSGTIKDASLEGEGEGGVDFGASCPLREKEAKSDVVVMDSESPKDGTLSDDGRSDMGSEKGSENSSNNSRQKNEDVQSSSSKVSSNLTPSDQRSSEEAGSSLKESDVATSKGSAMSPQDKLSTSTDSGSESVAAAKVDLLEKLFVPLKVQMCEGDWVNEPRKVMSLPFWQQEAHMSEDVVMHFNLQPLELSAILASDRRRLASMSQPASVSCQLLELLQKDGQGQKQGSRAIQNTSRDTSRDVTQATEDPSTKTGDSVSKVTQLQDSVTCVGSPETATKSGEEPAPVRDSGLLVSSTGAGEAGVDKQLKDKLQSLTSGQQSDSWPGDVIMKEVFLPVDLLGPHLAPDVPDRPQDTKILDDGD